MPHVETAPGNALRVPPHNYEAEKALLGGIFLNNRALERVQEFLYPEHFADPVNGIIYEACCKVAAQGIQANPVTLKHHLEKNDAVTQAGGIKYLAALMSGAVTVVNAVEYGKIIEDLWRRRELMLMAEELANEACFPDPDITAKAIQEAHEARLNAVADAAKGTTSLTSMRDALARVIDKWNNASRDGLVGQSYGFPTLDRQAGLMQGGQMIVVGARPSMGKTSFARTIAMNIAEQYLIEARANGKAPKHVLFFSTEMSTDQQAGAVLTGMTGIMPPRAMGDIGPNEAAALLKAANDFADLPIIWEDSAGTTLTQMRAAARRVQRMAGGLGCIIGDYLQIFGIERGVRVDNQNDRVTYLSKGWKELCRVLDVPGIVLSQLSRAVEQRENKRPNLSDLRDSGSIEQDADIIQFLYRDEYYLERDPPRKRDKESDEQFSIRSLQYTELLDKARGKIEVICAKVRLGAIGTVTLDFNGPRMIVIDPTSPAGPFKDYTTVNAQPAFDLH